MPVSRTDDVESLVAHVLRDGFVYLPSLLEPEAAESLRAEVARLELELGIAPALDPFSGLRTRRVYDLVSASRAFHPLLVHPQVLSIVRGILGVHPKIYNVSSITRPHTIAVYARLALEIAIFGSNFARLTLKKALTLRTLASLVNRRCARAW